MRRSWRLADALLLLLMFLLPLMILLGTAERTTGRATFWFWLLLLLPLRTGSRCAGCDDLDDNAASAWAERTDAGLPIPCEAPQ
jgi:hypothetical protein